jgi:crotonobetainyl-CoA:carnitine CoA-transferase CaiB-like acyl-CoA transferase
MPSDSHVYALNKLDTILTDFGLERKENGSTIHSVYTYGNLGCASTRLNFHKESDKAQVWELIRGADVWVDSYRGGELSKFGFADENIHAANGNLIITHVRCYGIEGLWKDRPGYPAQWKASPTSYLLSFLRKVF